MKKLKTLKKIVKKLENEQMIRPPFDDYFCGYNQGIDLSIYILKKEIKSIKKLKNHKK